MITALSALAAMFPPRRPAPKPQDALRAEVDRLAAEVARLKPQKRERSNYVDDKSIAAGWDR